MSDSYAKKMKQRATDRRRARMIPPEFFAPLDNGGGTEQRARDLASDREPEPEAEPEDHRA